MREPFFFPASDGLELFGTVTVPDEHAKEAPVVLFCPPFGEERQKVWRSTFLFSEVLAEHGYASMRFDYRGIGDSDGDMLDTSLDKMVEDTLTAHSLVKDKLQSDHIILLGIRLGAAVAVRSLDALGGARRCALWNPIVDGSRYFRELMRTEKMISLSRKIDESDQLSVDAPEGSVQVDADLISSEMVTQLKSLDLSDGPVSAEDIFITARSTDKREKADVEKLAVNARGQSCRAEVWTEEPGEYWTARSMHDAFFPEQTFSATVDWLQQGSG